MNVIPLAKPEFSGNEIKYVTDAIKSGWVSHRGVYVSRFEQAFERHLSLDSLHATACSSGTAALHLALLACGVGPGDEVIVPNITFSATASVVLHTGATVKLVDVDRNWGIGDFSHAITEKTKAVIPVHLYGERCDMESVMRTAKASGLKVIEDSCEAINIPPVGDFGCYSFYANKFITTGEGGMLVGRELSKVQSYRDGGFDEHYFCHLPGLNYRMTNIQAALGVAQMEVLTDFLERRHKNAAHYKKSLKGRGEWLFVTDVKDPARAKAELTDIETRRVFQPLNVQPPFMQEGDYPLSVGAYQTGLCLPTGPHVSEDEISYIIERIKPYA